MFGEQNENPQVSKKLFGHLVCWAGIYKFPVFFSILKNNHLIYVSISCRQSIYNGKGCTETISQNRVFFPQIAYILLDTLIEFHYSATSQPARPSNLVWVFCNCTKLFMNIKVFAHASYLWCWIKLLVFDFQKLPLGHQDHNCCSCCTLSYKCFVTSNTVLASEYYLDLLCLFRVSENRAKCIHCHSSAFPPGLHTLAVVGITLLR